MFIMGKIILQNKFQQLRFFFIFQYHAIYNFLNHETVILENKVCRESRLKVSTEAPKKSSVWSFQEKKNMITCYHDNMITLSW
jgi:hypothetical protein